MAFNLGNRRGVWQLLHVQISHRVAPPCLSVMFGESEPVHCVSPPHAGHLMGSTQRKNSCLNQLAAACAMASSRPKGWKGGFFSSSSAFSGMCEVNCFSSAMVAAFCCQLLAPSYRGGGTRRATGEGRYTHGHALKPREMPRVALQCPCYSEPPSSRRSRSV